MQLGEIRMPGPYDEGLSVNCVSEPEYLAT